MIYIIFIILYAIFDRVMVEFVGTLSVSAIFTSFAFVYLLFTGKVAKVLVHSKDLSYVTKLYVILFFIQLIAEIVVGNEINNTLRGLAVTILSYVKVVYMLIFFSKSPNTIKWYLVGDIIAGVIFTTPEEELSVAGLLDSGESLSFFKFKVAPLFSIGLVALSLFKIKKPLPVYMLFIVVGMMDILLGARSTGLLVMLTGGIAYVVNSGKARFTRKKLIRWSIAGLIALYPLYCVYVNAVLSGVIYGGNSHDQLQTISNPYNPLELLLAGRAESSASFVAISDSPLVGHGAWAPDPGYRYHQIMALAAHGRDYNPAAIRVNVIPTHSVIFGYGVNEGIFAMLLVTMIIWFFMKRGGSAIYKNSPYIYLLVYCISQLVWNSLFSPVAHFRDGFPFYFVCCYWVWSTMRNQRMIMKKKQEPGKA